MQSRSNKSVNIKNNSFDLLNTPPHQKDLDLSHLTSKPIKREEINPSKSISGLKIEYSDGLVEVEKPIEIAKDHYQAKTIGITPGEQLLSASYFNSRPITKKITVREEMSRLVDIVPSNFTISEGEDINITIIFDKPMPDSQQPPKLLLSETLKISSDFKLNPDKTSGYFTVRGVKVGSGVSDCYFAGMKKKIESLVIVRDLSNAVYQIIKTDLLIEDRSSIETYLKENHKIPRNNDLAIIKVIENSTIFAIRTYIYLNDDWINMSGKEQTSNMIFDDDIILAGDYTQFGNIIKKKDGELLKLKGLNVMELFKMILTKTIQPKIIKYPSINIFEHNKKEYIEFGEILGNVTYGENSRFIQGEYSFNQFSNVDILNTEIFRITSLGKTSIGNTLLGTDPLGGQLTEEMGFVQYEANIEYDNDHTILKDNIGNLATDDINIKSGIATKKSKKIQGYRKLFYGGLITDINSENIRAELSFENNNLIKNQFSFNIKPNTKSVIIAYPKNTHSIKKITNITIMGTDVTNIFEKTSLTIEGANRYKGIEYDIYQYTPANPFKYETEFMVELGGGTHE